MSEYIKIGPMRYEVIAKERLIGPDQSKADGVVDWHKGEIGIEEALCAQQRIETDWHEVFHIILTQAGIHLENEEQVVEVLAYGTMEVIHDNPKLVEATVRVQDEP